jgi:type IV secretory pathway TrbL component
LFKAAADATLTIAATAFNLLALANTGRIYRNRVIAAGEPSATTGRDLATVAACIAGTALCAVALAGWPR